MPVVGLKVKTCKTCGGEFQPNSGSAIYCSDRCHLHANVYREPHGCLEHMGRQDRDGYTELFVSGRRRVKSHRLAFELKNGPISDGVLVCHSCDNPPCVDENHLFAGSHADNSADCLSKGRAARGEKINRRMVTEKIALQVISDRRPAAVVAAVHGISQRAVVDIRAGRTWVWLTGVEKKRSA